MKQILNVAYYREEDWKRFLDSIDDRNSMHETWHEWHEAYLKTLNGLKAKGFKVRQITVDLDELQQYCREKGIKNTGQSRSQFVSIKKS
jgi:hypothetical protein